VPGEKTRHKESLENGGDLVPGEKTRHKESLEKAAKYGKQLELTEIFLPIFIETGN
jgi:hypothetical protein